MTEKKDKKVLINNKHNAKRAIHKIELLKLKNVETPSKVRLAINRNFKRFGLNEATQKSTSLLGTLEMPQKTNCTVWFEENLVKLTKVNNEFERTRKNKKFGGTVFKQFSPEFHERRFWRQESNNREIYYSACR